MTKSEAGGRLELWGEEAMEIPRGKTLKFRITDILYSGQTDFQRIDIVQTQFFGRMLLLDGVVMLTESDEFSYHEMSTHVPLMSHSCPENVLVIGGGDGGCVREALKHPTVRKVHLCEIDEGVVRYCKEFFPSIASGLSDPRVTVGYEDGAKHVREHPSEYDVIIVDSTDPIGPGAILFEEAFYKDVRSSLRKGGIAVTQSESFFDEADIVRRLYRFIPRLFAHYGYYWTCVPTYPSGIIGFSFVSNEVNPASVRPDPSRIPVGLRYYNEGIHQAAFQVPSFASEMFKVNSK